MCGECVLLLFQFSFFDIEPAVRISWRVCYIPWLCSAWVKWGFKNRRSEMWRSPRSLLGEILSQGSESGRGNVTRREAEVVKHRGEEEKERKWVGGHRVQRESNLQCDSSLVETLWVPTRAALSVKGNATPVHTLHDSLCRRINSVNPRSFVHMWEKYMRKKMRAYVCSVCTCACMRSDEHEGDNKRYSSCHCFVTMVTVTWWYTLTSFPVGCARL